MSTGAYELPFPVVPMGEWRERGLCREKIRNGEAEQRWWFPERGDPGVFVERARAICWDCPVRKECLDWAVNNNEGGGMWGGVSPRNRRGIGRVLPCCVCGVDVNVGRRSIKKARCSDVCEAKYQATRKVAYVESGRAAEVQRQHRERKNAA